MKRIYRDKNKSDTSRDEEPCLTPSLVGISSAKCVGVFEKKLCIKINTSLNALKIEDLNIRNNEQIFEKSIEKGHFKCENRYNKRFIQL